MAEDAMDIQKRQARTLSKSAVATPLAVDGPPLGGAWPGCGGTRRNTQRSHGGSISTTANSSVRHTTECNAGQPHGCQGGGVNRRPTASGTFGGDGASCSGHTTTVAGSAQRPCGNPIVLTAKRRDGLSVHEQADARRSPAAHSSATARRRCLKRRSRVYVRLK